jgi:hypothetical protein
MHPTQLAIERYHELLAQEDVAGLWQDFQEQMQENLLVFGDRPICNILRPHFLHPADFGAIAQAAETVVSALHKIYQALRRGALDIHRLLQLSPQESALLTLPDTYGWPDVSARMDAFWMTGAHPGEGELHFLEYNADSPGGLIYGDVLTDLFKELPVVQRFAQEFRVQSFPVRPKLYETLIACYRAWARNMGKPSVSAPTIAIVDWRTVRTRNEFVLAARFFEAQGSRTFICAPDELVVRKNRLWVGGDVPVDILYKRVVVSEFLDKFATPAELRGHPLFQAAEQQLACVVNGFACQLLHNKALFALVSDEKNADFLSSEEQIAARRFIPWTRLVEKRYTVIDGRKIDLIDFVQRNQDQLVLKPIRAYGGAGVILGWEASADEWQAALARALNEPYVVQRRVPVPTAQFPLWDQGYQLVPRMVDVDPYVWQGEHVAHAGVRLGAEGLLNVSAGGGSAVPLFLVDQAR